MKAKPHYEKYWSENKNDGFFEYERNLVLPKLFSKKERILDVGCGDGVVSEFLQKELGNDVVGVDISETALKRAKARGVAVKLIDAQKRLPFDKNIFDSVFWGDNVEHLFEPEKTLKEIARVLKKEGRLVMSCPNMAYWRYRLHYLLKGSLADTEWTSNPPWGWSHIRFYNSKILNDFLTQNGFEDVKILGVNKRFPDKYFALVVPNIFANILVLGATKK